jgi:NNP family nitrate/nitrite transporter-like MFS transporter
MSIVPQHQTKRRLLTVWTPEDEAFWEHEEGEAIAKLNLWISVPALFLAFAIWQVWSVVAVSLPKLGFNYSPASFSGWRQHPRCRAPRCASFTPS